MKDKLKKGQAFIGQDDEKYYFLGYDYDKQIVFTNLDLWTDSESKYVVKNNLFIKEILDEKSDVIENIGWYYESLDEFNNATINEKIKRCLDIIESNNDDEIRFKPTKIKELVRGQAYNRLSNQFYEVIGFIVDNDVYVDDDLTIKSQTGFYPIYHSNCSDTSTLIFEQEIEKEDNTYSGKSFISSNDDKVNILEILMSEEKVNENIDEEQKNRLKKENEFCK